MAASVPALWTCTACGSLNIINKREDCHVCGVARPPVKVDEQMPWRCFHCDEVFSDATSAAEHFGTSERQQPACQIDVAEYRRMEEINRRHCEEDTDLHRQMYALKCEHQRALLREEEKGYARGLADGMKEKT